MVKVSALPLAIVVSSPSQIEAPPEADLLFPLSSVSPRRSISSLREIRLRIFYRA